MNLAAIAPDWIYYLLLALLAAAAIEDVARRRISNLVPIGIAVLAAASALMAGVDLSLWQNLSVCILLLVLGTFAFGRGYLGGGDVKLMAAVGLWLSFAIALRVLAAIFIIGGVIAMVYLMIWTIRRTPRGPNGKREIPYALAIGLGAAFIFTSVRPTDKLRAIDIPVPQLQKR